MCLSFVPPFDWEGLLGFLAVRAIPGVESVAEGCYRRTIAIGDAVGSVEVCRPSATASSLTATLRLPSETAIPSVVERLRRMFDLDVDPAVVAAHLSSDTRLAPLVEARPGLRVPGAWEPFELAVRAILGQQISVAAATRLAGRLTERYGDPLPDAARQPGLTHLFPSAARLAAADPRDFAMPQARAAAIINLAAVVARDPTRLDPAGNLDAATRHLTKLPGIGAWTAHYIAMRAWREPDAFPAADLVLLRAMSDAAGVRPSPAQLIARAEAWRPWRAYAALHLWASQAAAKPARSAAA